MTNKEIAERLREIIAHEQHPYTKMEELADELDPPRPEPGTVVWWRVTSDDDWHLGTTTGYGIVPADNPMACWNWDVNGIEYKPARILAPDEVAVKVPPVRAWPLGARKIGAYYYDPDAVERIYLTDVITRAEAERMER